LEENELRQRTTYTYDDYNRLLSVARPLNGITTYTYTPTNGGGGSPYKHTTANPDTVTVRVNSATNIVTSNVYDQNFRKTSSSVAGRTTWFHYDAVGNQDYVTDPRGTGSGDAQFTTYTDYDERNRKSQIREPLGRTTQFLYEDGINLTTIIRPDTFRETKVYDAMNRLISHTVPKSASVSLTTTFGYWPSGRLYWVQDPKQQGTNLATSFEYNESDQMITMHYPGSTETQAWVYDDAHNLASRTTVHGETQSFTYDVRNRKVGMTWSNNADWATYGYDDVGRLTSAANPNSTVTRRYDDAGRMILDQQNVNGLGTVPVNYGYDDDGKENHLWVPGANPSYDYTYGYDAMGRFETITPTGGSVAFQYYYDAASNETRRHNYSSSPQLDQFYNRDNLNRIWRLEVKKSTMSLGREDYGYDVMNRLISVTWEDNKQDQFGYYRDGELNWVLYGTSPTPTPSPPPSPTPTPGGSPTPTPPGGSPTPTPPGGQVTEPSFAPGGGNIYPYYYVTVTISTTTTGAQIRYTLDGGAHWTTIANGGSVTFQPSGGKTLTAIGFKSGMTDSNPHSEDYIRDGGQGPGDPNKEETTVEDLLSLPEGMEPGNLQTANRSVAYYYDGAGNRTMVTDDVNGNTSYTPNNLNQYINLVGPDAITNGPEHEIVSYRNCSYTYLNDEHLIEVTNTTNSTGNNDYQLAYDALGRCVKRTVDGVTKYYIYDGEKAILEYNSSAQIIGRNVYGKGIDEILQRTDYSYNPSLTWYYQQDHEGSVTHLTSNGGNIIEKYRYDVYGAPTIYPPAPGATPIPVSSYSNRFMFTGREYSNMFGFYEYRARAYHAGLGRFMSEDPKGFVRRAGLGTVPADWTFAAHPDEAEFNLFRYCGNDPIDFTDPMGLDTMANAMAVAEAVVPGQYEYNQMVASFQSGNYGNAAGWGVTWVSSAVVGVVSGTTSTRLQAGLRAAETAAAQRTVAAVIRVTSNTAKTGTASLTKFYPKNAGFAGATRQIFLMPGQIIDRYGGSGYSRFFSPTGTPDWARALPPGTASQPLRSFEVVKPFEVQSGKVGTWFYQPGGGTAYQSPVKLETLLKRGIIKEVTP
jgi:RHS repeat-associated protein